MLKKVASRFLVTALFVSILVVHGRATPMAVQVAESRKGMVSAGHPDATEAGVAVLKAGGNAIDAAVAVGFALGVTEPYGSGVGGKLVLMYRDARTGRVSVVEALDQASTHLDPKAFGALPLSERRVGANSVAVPGHVAGLLAAHERWGSRPLIEVMAPAVRLAEKGFEVRQGQVRFFRSQQEKLRADPELSRLYLPGGSAPAAGDRLVNADLGRTLRLIAQKGRAGFYEGPVAEAIVSALQAGGSPVQLDDFARYRARIDEPLMTRFRGHEVYSAPPPVSGGGIFLLTLAALEADRYPTPAMAGVGIMQPASMDRMMRVFLEANGAAREVLGDRDDSRLAWQRLMGSKSISDLRKAAQTPVAGSRAVLQTAEGEEADAAETTHFVVVDGAGNVVSATQSQSNHFGAGLVAPGTGVVLNNSLSNFNRIVGNPNQVAPGRRPRTTIAPAIVTRGNRLVLAFGLPGGSRIPSAMTQVTLDYLGYGRPLDEAIGAPRFHPVTRRQGETVSRFETERETDYRLAETLRTTLGWEDGTEQETESFGGFTAIEVMPDGRLRGYADQRRTNTAMGY